MGHQTTFKGAPLALGGKPLKVGDMLPPFKLTGSDMQDVRSDTFKGKPLVIAAVPSLDTPTCAIETKRFNEEVAKHQKSFTVLTVSMDLPFAQKRWCGTEGVENVVTASDFKYREFGPAFGVAITDWGLLARAVFVADASGKLTHVEYVAKVEEEPDYGAALKALDR